MNQSTNEVGSTLAIIISLMFLFSALAPAERQGEYEQQAVFISEAENLPELL